MRAGVDLALAAGAFGQKVTLVFSGPALELLADSPPHDEALYRLLGSLPYYDIERVFALGESKQKGTHRNDLNVLPLAAQRLSDMMSSADIVVNY